MRKTIYHYGRRCPGKSEAQRIIVEASLDAGKRVLCCSKDKMEIQTRKGHLTLHELIKGR